MNDISGITELKRKLPDYDNCLVNLANSILKKFGAETAADTLPMADRVLAGDFSNVVLLLLDAMGMSSLEKHLEEDGFFRSHLAGSFCSVYPPTTVAATTSVLSAQYPNEHGWLGWDMYYPKLDKNVTVFLNIVQMSEKEGAVPSRITPDGNRIWDKRSLKRQRKAAAYNAGFEFTPYRSLIDRINDAGGSAYFAMPYRPPYPNDLDAVCRHIETLCSESGKKFIYAYWNEPDATMHRTGTMSGKTHEVMTGLEKRIEELASGLSDTLLLVTADHGHMDSRNLCILDYPDVMRCLVRPPSFEPRTLNLFVKEEYLETFPAVFRENFGDDFLLLTRDEVIASRLFGPGKDRDDLEELIGDYVALAVSDRSIFNTHYEAQSMPGMHAGLTPEEYTIPLIVIET